MKQASCTVLKFRKMALNDMTYKKGLVVQQTKISRKNFLLSGWLYYIDARKKTQVTGERLLTTKQNTKIVGNTKALPGSALHGIKKTDTTKPTLTVKNKLFSNSTYLITNNLVFAFIFLMVGYL